MRGDEPQALAEGILPTARLSTPPVAASFLTVGRALRLTSGRVFFPPATALLVGVLLASAIVFGGNGVRPADVVVAMREHPGARLAFWGAWLALVVPIVARLVDRSPLRALPVPTWHAVGWLVPFALFAQIPWMLLFGLGEGLAGGLASGLLAVTVGFALASGAHGLLLAALATIALSVPVAVAAPLALVMAILASRRAWIAGPREEGPPLRMLRRAPAVIALATSALLELARGHRAVLARAVALGVGSAAVLNLLAVHQPTDAPLARALAWSALPSAIAGAWIAAPIAQHVRSFEPLLRTLGRSPKLLVGSAALAVGVPALVLGSLSGPWIGAWSASLALLVRARGYGRTTREPSRQVVVATMVGAGALVLVLVVGTWALPIVLVAALAALVRGFR